MKPLNIPLDYVKNNLLYKNYMVKNDDSYNKITMISQDLMIRFLNIRIVSFNLHD